MGTGTQLYGDRHTAIWGQAHQNHLLVAQVEQYNPSSCEGMGLISALYALGWFMCMLWDGRGSYLYGCREANALSLRCRNVQCIIKKMVGQCNFTRSGPSIPRVTWRDFQLRPQRRALEAYIQYIYIYIYTYCLICWQHIYLSLSPRYCHRPAITHQSVYSP